MGRMPHVIRLGVATLALALAPHDLAGQGETHRKSLWVEAGVGWISTYHNGLPTTNLGDASVGELLVASRVSPRLSLGIGASLARQRGPSDSVTLWALTGEARYHYAGGVFGIRQLTAYIGAESGVRFGTATGHAGHLGGPYVGGTLGLEVQIWRGTRLGIGTPTTTVSIMGGGLTLQGVFGVHASTTVRTW